MKTKNKVDDRTLTGPYEVVASEYGFLSVGMWGMRGPSGEFCGSGSSKQLQRIEMIKLNTAYWQGHDKANSEKGA